MAGRVAEIDQAALGEDDDLLAVGNSTSSTCGLISVHFMFCSAPIWISLSKWPMLHTIAMFFIARM
jgi:hypothetical protein